MSGGWTPLFAVLCRVFFLVQVSADVDKRLVLLIHIVDHFDDLAFDCVYCERLLLFVPIVAVGNATAVPLSVGGSRKHNGSNTLGGHIALQLRKDQNDF